MSHFNTVKDAYEAPKSILAELLGNNLADKFTKFRSKFDYEKEIKKIKEKNIEIIVQEDEAFPESLKNLSDAPICLYVRGNINLFVADSVPLSGTPATISFAIVGTRMPTPYGIQITQKFAYELATAGFIIVSGMAMGVDAIAHQAVLAAKQKTIAVLGCGVDIIYPAINTNLYWQIIKNEGLIISEFPVGHTVMPGLFIARNRLISGLAKGVLVVEGLEDSGSLITARYAAEQGKEVFAPPSPITSAMAAAPNKLIKQGATLVTSTADIIEAFGLQILPIKKQEVEKNLTAEEKIIFDALQYKPMQVDEIVLEKKFTVEKVLNILSVMEINGLVEKNSEGKYQIKFNV